MAVIQETSPVQEIEKTQAKFELQAQILVACYSELIRVYRSLITFPKDTETRRLDSNLFSKSKNKPKSEEIKILKTNPDYKDHPYFRLLLQTLEHPLEENVRNFGFWTLTRKRNNRFNIHRVHHLDQTKSNEGETEFLNGMDFGARVNPEMFNPQTFPQRINHITFLEIEPGKAMEQFEKICQFDPQDQFLRVLSARLTDACFYRDWEFVNRAARQPFWFAVCFIKPSLQLPPSPYYVLQRPPVILHEDKDFFPQITRNGTSKDFELPLPLS